MDGGLGSSSGFLPESLVLAAQIGNHAEGQRAVFVAVYLDVALEIPEKLAEVAGHRVIEVADKGAEHRRDGVLAAKGEGGCLCGNRAVADDVEGALDELAGGRWGDVEGGVEGGGMGGLGGLEDGADGGGARSGALHGFEVELEVACGTAFVEVGLFTEDDFVEEAAAGREAGGGPGDVGAGERALQALEEAHEVPDGEDMGLHKEAQVLDRADAAVERMRGQTLAEGREAGLDEVEGGVGGSGGHTRLDAEERGLGCARGSGGFVGMEGGADLVDVGSVGADGLVEGVSGDAELFGPVGDVGG